MVTASKRVVNRLGVLVQVVGKRQKRAHGTTWFPDGWVATPAQDAGGQQGAPQQQVASRHGPDWEEVDKYVEELFLCYLIYSNELCGNSSFHLFFTGSYPGIK